MIKFMNKIYNYIYKITKKEPLDFPNFKSYYVLLLHSCPNIPKISPKSMSYFSLLCFKINLIDSFFLKTL